MYSSIYVGSYNITDITGFRVTSVDYLEQPERQLNIHNLYSTLGSSLSSVQDGKKTINISGIYSLTNKDELVRVRANILKKLNKRYLQTLAIPYVVSGVEKHRKYEVILENEIYKKTQGGTTEATFIFVVPSAHGYIDTNNVVTSGAITDSVAEIETPIISTYSLTGLTADSNYYFKSQITAQDKEIAVYFTATGTTATIVFDHVNKSVTIAGEEVLWMGSFFKIDFSMDCTISHEGATATQSHAWDSWVN